MQTYVLHKVVFMVFKTFCQRKLEMQVARKKFKLWYFKWLLLHYTTDGWMLMKLIIN